MIVLKFPIFQAQLQGGLSHLCTYDKSHTYSCGKSSKLVMGVRLLKGENWVKMFSCYSTLPQSQWLTRGTKQNQTESQSRTKIIHFWQTHHILLFVTLFLVQMHLVQQNSNHCLQLLLTTKEKWLVLTQDASFVCHFTTRMHWWSAWFLLWSGSA